MSKWTINYLKLANGKKPLRDWLLSLDIKSRARIQARLDRLEQGNWGDYKHIASEIFELREHFGKGYRIYVAKKSKTLILLINGGDKSSQNKDIKKAKKYWNEYKGINA